MEKQTENKTESWKMFNRIAGRYDLLNRLLSARQDVAWRKKLAQYLPQRENLELLDLATGTGDQILFLLSETHRITKATGMDMSEGMLAEGKKKIAERNLENTVSLQVGDATNLPAEDRKYDVTTISFGIRNVIDVKAALKEMHRVLKPGGRTMILEFSLPNFSLIQKPYLFYFRHVLPKIGSIISGDGHAYKYLNNTVEDFPYGDDFLKLMKDCGFTNLEAHPVSLGIATIYVGDRPQEH